MSTAATTVVGTELVSASGVGVHYGSDRALVRALRGIDLTIEAGERVALWGRSGSGKTTVLHVLGGLVVPNEGRVTWHGEELSSLDAAARGRARARGIAYVLQGSNLLPHFTAFENVAFAREATLASRDAGPGAGNDVSPSELLELVGLADKLDSLPSELSGGEAQRVAIARALAQRPEMLLCDEPTGQLDSDTAARVLDLVDALQQEFGFALVTATHAADVAARADRIVELTDGAIAGESRP